MYDLTNLRHPSAAVSVCVAQKERERRSKRERWRERETLLKCNFSSPSAQTCAFRLLIRESSPSFHAIMSAGVCRCAVYMNVNEALLKCNYNLPEFPQCAACADERWPFWPRSHAHTHTHTWWFHYICEDTRWHDALWSPKPWPKPYWSPESKTESPKALWSLWRLILRHS